MKTIISAIIALGCLVGAATAAPLAPIHTDTVIEWGCDPKGH